MKKSIRRILENQLEIMNALEYFMMPEKPKYKQHQMTVARRDIKKARIETRNMIEQDDESMKERSNPREVTVKDLIETLKTLDQDSVVINGKEENIRAYPGKENKENGRKIVMLT